jgi:ankyrin repeat protein
MIYVPFTRSVEKHDKTLPLLDVADSASGNTPLMYATMANKIHLLESMILLGSQINVTNKVKYGDIKGLFTNYVDKFLAFFNHLGGCRLQDLSISQVIDHVNGYKFKCSHWWKIYLKKNILKICSPV